MRRLGFAAALMLVLAGCGSSTTLPDRTVTDRTMFGAKSMRIHPIFTQRKDWSGEGKLDGIEVLIEMQDQFGDPTKAAGKVIFELYTYRVGDPLPRGRRVVNPWIGSLQTLEDQQAHWNRTSRTYSFQLAYPEVSLTKGYVLAATFDSPDGRFFDQIVLEEQHPEAARVPTTSPSTKPTAPFGLPASGPTSRTVEP